MLEAVEVIHDERIVHGDLKPANFLLVNNEVKLIDFGIAKSVHDDTTNIARTQQVGTVSYMAPEAVGMDYKQGAGGNLPKNKLKYGRKADVWSLGIILYQLVFRKTPFAHLMPVQRLYAIADDNHEIEKELPFHCPELADVLRLCLQRDVAARASLEDLLNHPFLVPTAALRVEPKETVEVTKDMVASLTGTFL